MKILRLGTRKSALAQAQAAWTSNALRAAFPDLQIEIVLITTSGDQIQNHPHPASRPSPLSMERDLNSPSPYSREKGLGDEGNSLKALFTKEIEEALLDNRIDMAVHSLKDMASDLPKGLIIGAVPEREDPRDVWISKNRVRFDHAPKNAKIGTGAVRRQAQLKSIYPQATILPIRGNIDTRLRKLRPDVTPAGRKPGSIMMDPPPTAARDDGYTQLDGMVLALAGLKRLGLESAATDILSIDILLPAVGQGCLGIQIRDRDAAMIPLMKALDHPHSRAAALAERSFLKTLGGSCQTPIAGHAVIENGELILKGLVISPDGQRRVDGKENGRPFDAEGVGERLAQKLMAAGADKILSL